MSRRHAIDFFVTEAFIGMKRSCLMTIISMATISISLIVFGLFLMLSINIHNIVSFVSSKLEIRAYLSTSTTVPEIHDIQQLMMDIDGIRHVEYINKDRAWNTFKAGYHHLALPTHIDYNPLPDSFRIKLDDNRHIKWIAEKIKRVDDHIGDVVWGGMVAERISAMSSFARMGGIVLVVLLTGATLMIVMNTIRLTVMVRDDEISIMQLVGATDSFIRWPFIIEGMVIGIVGSLVAILFLSIFYYVFVIRFQAMVPFFPIIPTSPAITAVYVIMGVMGVVLGVLGAYIGVSRMLKLAH